MKFNSLGEATYGTYGVGGVSVDGAVPAGLAALEIGSPAWQSDTQLIYQDCTTGVCKVNRLTYPAETIDTLSATGSNTLCGGGGVWAKWLGGTTTTSYGGSYTNSTLLTVSPEGHTVIVTNRSAGVGLAVYDETGVEIYSDPNLMIVRDNGVRLRDNILAYQTAARWNLIDIAESSSLGWFPRPGVVLIIPVTIDGLTYVIEQTNNEEGLTLRPSNRDRGWQLNATPFAFNPDGVLLSDGTVRVGSCTTPGEGTTTLQVYDITINNTGTLTMSIGTVSGGGIVYGADTTVNFQGYTVGPFISGLGQRDLAPNVAVPFEETIVGRDGKTTKPWVRFFTDITKAVSTVGAAVQKIPNPSEQTASFDQVSSDGQPSIVAEEAGATLAINSADASVTVTLNPGSNTVDLSVVGGGAWLIAPTVTLTNAQIKALPTVGQIIVPAAGAGMRIADYSADVQFNFADGAYTNIHLDAYCAMDGGNYLGNDSGIPLTFLSDIFGAAADRSLLFQPYTYSEPVNQWGNLPNLQGTLSNVAIGFTFGNGGAGNLTGGHANNTIVFNVVYRVVAVS